MKVLNMALTHGEFTSETDFAKGGKQAHADSASRKEFCSLVKSANFIAIDSDYLYSVTGRSLGHNPVTNEGFVLDENMASLPVCPPFRRQWVELSYTNTSSLCPSIEFGKFIITVLGMLINETSPNVYDIFCLENHRPINEKDGFNKITVARNVSGTAIEKTNLQMCFATWMKAINSGALGIEEGEDVAMIPKENGKKDGKKKPHQIRRIVRIVPKNAKHKAEPIMTRGKIDFSHRWEVRGHWRRVSGMGKDREGNYEIRGLTWVSNFIKGPEELPLIQKLRWVPGQAS